MSVDGHVHDSGILFKDLLGAIAVVYIPVQYEHSLSARCLQTEHTLAQ